MNRKQNKKYTTIQIDKDIAEHIRVWCKAANMIISRQTETLWVTFISASMSGSVN
jgi:hypothetical protein